MGKSYVEQCLWEYRANKALIQRLKVVIRTLASVRGHSYEAHIAGTTTDPVADVTNKILNLESRIEKVIMRTQPIDKLRADMFSGAHKDRYIQEVLNLRYIEHNTVESILDSLHISSSTYGRAKQKLIRLARKYFGVEDDINYLDGTRESVIKKIS